MKTVDSAARLSTTGKILEEPFVRRCPAAAARTPPAARSTSCASAREEKDGTIFFDITDLDLEGYNKFIPYYLHPDSIYSVGLSKSSFRVKVSVGSNPWSKREPTVNLAKVCERYGGGGHARVGAISFDVTPETTPPVRRRGNRRGVARQRADGAIRKHRTTLGPFSESDR